MGDTHSLPVTCGFLLVAAGTPILAMGLYLALTPWGEGRGPDLCFSSYPAPFLSPQRGLVTGSRLGPCRMARPLRQLDTGRCC